MKASVIKNPRVVAKKSPTNSNSRHAKKPTAKANGDRPAVKRKYRIGENLSGIAIHGDLTEPTVPWTW